MRWHVVPDLSTSAYRATSISLAIQLVDTFVEENNDTKLPR